MIKSSCAALFTSVLLVTSLGISAERDVVCTAELRRKNQCSKLGRAMGDANAQCQESCNADPEVVVLKNRLNDMGKGGRYTASGVNPPEPICLPPLHTWTRDVCVAKCTGETPPSKPSIFELNCRGFK